MSAHVANQIQNSRTNLRIFMSDQLLDVFEGFYGIDVLVDLFGMTSDLRKEVAGLDDRGRDFAIDL